MKITQHTHNRHIADLDKRIKDLDNVIATTQDAVFNATYTRIRDNYKKERSQLAAKLGTK